MEIKINDEAAAWYQSELNLKKGNLVRFFVQYGGSSPIQQGFSLGISRETPESDIGVQVMKNGITYYVLDRDIWYFDGHNLIISFNDRDKEPELRYI